MFRSIHKILVIQIVAVFPFALFGQPNEQWNVYPSIDSATATDAPEKQDTDTIKESIAKQEGTIEIIGDYRIKLLLDEQIAINDTLGTMKGFRVQLFFGSGIDSRNKAKEVKANFLHSHSDVPIYTIYSAPDFKIRVGNFKTRVEAYRFHKEIELQFPSSYIVEDQIELPSTGESAE